MSPPWRLPLWRIEVGRTHNAAGENVGAEAGRESFDLCLDRAGHVGSGAVRHMAVGPGGVFSRGSPRGVEEAGLDEDDERSLRQMPFPGRALRCGDFVEGAAEVDGGGAEAVGRFPGGRCVESPVHFENAGAVAEALELMGVGGGGDGRRRARATGAV